MTNLLIICIFYIQPLKTLKVRLLDLFADLTNLFIRKSVKLRGDNEIFNCLVIRYTHCRIVTYLVIQSPILKSKPRDRIKFFYTQNESEL